MRASNSSLILRASPRALVGLNTRAIINSTFTRFNSTDAKDNKKAGGSQQQVFDPRFIGLTRDIYIPVAYNKLPSPFAAPKQVWNALLRRFYTLGMNTVQVAFFRWQSGLKPQFLLWKNKAIESYVNVNKAFAAGNIKPVEKQVSVWVEKSLKSRVGSIPKNVKLDWKLVKFNENPKLVVFRPIMLPGRPVEYAQVIYKFNTQQELINVNLKTDKVKKLERNVIDYAGFVINLDTNDVLLAGTLFENNIEDKIPRPEDVNQEVMFEDMRINGDLFRAPPQLK